MKRRVANYLYKSTLQVVNHPCKVQALGGYEGNLHIR